MRHTKPHSRSVAFTWFLFRFLSGSFSFGVSVQRVQFQIFTFFVHSLHFVCSSSSSSLISRRWLGSHVNFGLPYCYCVPCGDDSKNIVLCCITCALHNDLCYVLEFHLRAYPYEICAHFKMKWTFSSHSLCISRSLFSSFVCSFFFFVCSNIYTWMKAMNKWKMSCHSTEMTTTIKRTQKKKYNFSVKSEMFCRRGCRLSFIWHMQYSLQFFFQSH